MASTLVPVTMGELRAFEAAGGCGADESGAQTRGAAAPVRAVTHAGVGTHVVCLCGPALAASTGADACIARC